jgi:hypothetical protein
MVLERRVGGSGGAASWEASVSTVGCCDGAVGRRGVRGWVELEFMRTWSRRPWCMAMDCGGYLQTSVEVRPGH